MYALNLVRDYLIDLKEENKLTNKLSGLYLTKTKLTCMIEAEGENICDI